MIQPDSAQQLPLWRGTDRWVRRFSVASLTDPKKAYVVAVDAAGQVGCSCPAWTHDPKRRACKHIRTWRREVPLA